MAKIATRNTLSPTALSTGAPILTTDLEVMLESHNYAVSQVPENVVQFYGRTGTGSERAYISDSATERTIFRQWAWIPRHAQALRMQVLLQPAAGTTVLVRITFNEFAETFSRSAGGAQPTAITRAISQTGWSSLIVFGRVTSGSSDAGWLERLTIRTAPITTDDIPDPPTGE